MHHREVRGQAEPQLCWNWSHFGVSFKDTDQLEPQVHCMMEGKGRCAVCLCVDPPHRPGLWVFHNFTVLSLS